MKRKEYLLKLGTARVTARIEEVLRVMDASTLDTAEQRTAVQRHDVAECILKLDRAIACDLADGRSGHQPVRDRRRLRDPRRRHRARGAAGPPGRRPRPGAAPQLQVGAQHHPARAPGREIQPEGRAHPGDRRAREPTGRASPRRSRASCSRTARWSTSSASAACSTASTPTSSGSRRTGWSTCAGWPRWPTSCSTPASSSWWPRPSSPRTTSRSSRPRSSPTGSRPSGRARHITTDLAVDLHLPGGAVPEAVDQLKAHLQDKGIIFRPW